LKEEAMMFETDGVNRVRGVALDRIEKQEKWLWYALSGIAIYELAFLILLLYFTDFDNQTHIVIFVSTFLVYGTLALMILLTGLHINRGLERILQAILLQENGPPNPLDPAESP
jgi:hypothetical protein